MTATTGTAPSGDNRGVVVRIPCETVDAAEGVAVCRLSLHDARKLHDSLGRAIAETDEANDADDSNGGA
jgi:hypothetical protein